ncbi:MAG: insulinase family protein, partial [Chlamydiia bacterium]|nr:insulinase family protein [Chlamydiia bacterium]
FFIAPRFNPSGVDRECKAIHQEYCKNVPLDAWRMHYVKKELANAHHPFHAFCIGNLETLAHISQDELKAWYHAHYSAHQMHLVVYSPLDIERLEKEIVDLFSGVNRQDCVKSLCAEPILLGQEPLQLCVIKPVQELQILELCWEIPRFYGQDLEVHADKLLSHVLGHEGSTSLLAQLKREQLAEGLGVGAVRAGRDQALLSLTITLTEGGVREYERVIERCFEALATLKESGIPLYIFDEICQLEELKYRFQSREEVFEFVAEYATHMVDEPLETFPRRTLFPSRHAPEQVNALIAYLTPQNCQYTLVASEELTHISLPLREQWLGVEYALVPIPQEKQRRWERASLHTAMSVPRPNPFIPVELILTSSSAKQETLVPHPILIADEEWG